MTDFAALRRNMVDCQLRTFDVTNRGVLAAMDMVPRELFLPVERRALAYLDQNVPAGVAGRVLLAPMFIARMLQALEIKAGQTVLSYAGGTGYTAAVAAAMGAAAVTFDTAPGAAEAARAALSSAGADVTVADTMPSGSFDAILVNGSVDHAPSALLDKLTDGGRLAAIMRSGAAGRVTVYQRTGDVVASRGVFDATAPVLEEFREKPAFAL
jgi:protein-L-isoaspartate(D-aspartate) O-methyltransferase